MNTIGRSNVDISSTYPGIQGNLGGHPGIQGTLGGYPGIQGILIGRVSCDKGVSWDIGVS